jgi:formate-dependent nitrite reductase cytochrome c552 subunit
MRRRIAVLCAAVVMLVSSSALFADPPDVVILSKSEVFGSLSRPPVRFTHGHHMSAKGVSCFDCHHMGDTVRCETCHTTPRSLQLAFHTLCVTCHDNEKKAGRATGPRACGECHQ